VTTLARVVFAAAFFLPAGYSAEFEVATVKRSPPPPGDSININPGTLRNGRLTFTNASLSDCLKFAWGIMSDAQISGPDWIKLKAVRFDIVALTAPDTPEEQVYLMLQALLADRLKLALHHEQRTLPWLALVIGKGGPKFTASSNGTRSSAMGGRILGDQMSMQRLATFISRLERQTVVDKTGLRGNFALKLEWSPDDAAATPSGPSIFTALQEQLGLRLESQKGPLDVLVIDHAEQIPVEN
jgi:uncharacterized protein (TIGR03435 family)